MFAAFLSSFRSRAALHLEVLALRHQLTVLQRSVKRPKLNAVDRFLWAWLAYVWRDWRSALVIVQPETVIGWHRKSRLVPGDGWHRPDALRVQTVASVHLLGPMRFARGTIDRQGGVVD